MMSIDPVMETADVEFTTIAHVNAKLPGTATP
jgi:hypothetical protein